MRLVAVTVRPDGRIVTLRGKNGNGKTSTLDSIAVALGGKSFCPEVPIRLGERNAFIEVNLGEYVVRRTWELRPSADGDSLTSKLEVRASDGSKVEQPQTLLNRLIGEISFDPSVFPRKKPKEQAEILRSLVGIDTTAIEAEEANAYAERTIVSREVKVLAAQVAAMPVHSDAPAQPIDTAQAARELEEIRKLEGEKAQRKAAADSRAREAAASEARAAAIKAEIETLRQRAIALKQEQDGLSASASVQKVDAQRLALEAEAILVPDAAAIMARISGAQAANAKYAANLRRDEEQDKLAAKRDAEMKLTARIESARAAKQSAIANAKFPVPGLGLSESGLTFNGLPFEQASGAEKLRVSVAIGIAMNPKIRVLLMRDGPLLDSDAMELLAKTAEEHQVQLWIERVDGKERPTVVIEDGHVVGADLAAAAE